MIFWTILPYKNPGEDRIRFGFWAILSHGTDVNDWGSAPNSRIWTLHDPECR